MFSKPSSFVTLLLLLLPILCVFVCLLREKVTQMMGIVTGQFMRVNSFPPKKKILYKFRLCCHFEIYTKKGRENLSDKLTF